ncbi:DNA polymerase delta subunit 4 [Cinnamomum micranthum f. kanehirae]|uniref:DNA polymerase delta subunit 4 n=1 Tax=Cinnamomum micranthum f. kanehirae TaxID=337451 RepID=A0A443P935_9MAGN|nr:DNA polymerase delta subunit 4 [Cinnamomum micranthum f. kanehirae]
MASGDIKGFYRQRKSGGISKSSSSKASNSKKSSSSTRNPMTTRDDYDKNEEVLRQFDLNMSYGPCLGISRLERWERANKLGLNPPKEVENLLIGSQSQRIVLDTNIYMPQEGLGAFGFFNMKSAKAVAMKLWMQTHQQNNLIKEPGPIESYQDGRHPDDYDKNEEVLRQFDLNMSYGPCLGISRLERWERANKLGLNPPKEVENLLIGSQSQRIVLDTNIYMPQEGLGAFGFFNMNL